MTGTLYVVATPIGNLEDITLRALRVLRECGLIACEDTRQTRKLLEHFGIATPTVSYHEHNEAARAAELVAKIEAGASVALVSDAGTPLIADPGYRIVRAAIDAGVTVVPVPGASAAVGALSAAGLPSDSFRFCGFLPPKSSQRRRVLEELQAETGTLIFYETPHRILDALDDIAAVMGARPLAVARELSKIHEEFLRGTAVEVRATLAARPSVKGEFTVLIGKAEPGVAVDQAPIEDAVRAAEREGLSRMDAIKRVARERGLGKRDVYRLVEGG
ncbi:MAG TPA: 16S rRNA (cytidine(1402)-2'-O)-methyltransferase [Bryobacteraceae bacterium]|nr:16S rRNA (cytidine(1402)-2'-O)-methyltransferase [Bryobacteraceae bacterium]